MESNIFFTYILNAFGGYIFESIELFSCRLGGNPICNKHGISSNPKIAYHQQLNCRYNNSVLPLLGDTHKNSISPIYCNRWDVI